jgi:hypothetical protein
MMSATCLAMIVFFESRGEPVITQRYVASVAIERAKQEQVSLCSSMRKPRAYSWYWDKKPNAVAKDSLKPFEVLAVREIRKPTLTGYMYFNEKKMLRRYATPKRLIKSGHLVFY